MNTTIAITSIICVTILIIVCIVQFVQYKLKSNDTLKDIKSELKYLNSQLETNNKWIEIYDRNIRSELSSYLKKIKFNYQEQINEIKNETNEL